LSPAVAALVREERLLEAAALASQERDHETSRRLYERACAFGPAAREALLGGDPGAAIGHAAEAGDATLAEEALAALEGHGAVRERLASNLETRGHHVWAARLYEASEKPRDAARAYEKAGNSLRAARILETIKDVVAAAKVLEGAIRRTPDRYALHVAYGALLLRYGKAEHATRALQKVPPRSPERRLALTWLVRGLRELGYTQAEAEAQHELDTLGGPADATADEPIQGTVTSKLFGRYEIVREVASSPSARVVECVDSVRREHVAVKIFAGYDARGAGRDALARFEREVRVLGALDHPNVLPLRDYLPEGPALVLAWMKGGTLDDMLRKEPIAPARAVEIAIAVLSALGEAHRVGVLHRDIKPANVLFDDAGVTRLGDFGAAHLGDLSATATAGLIGTLAYMSPEQREGRAATVRSDIYGVGAILWEMLTGERPRANLDDAPSSVTQPNGARAARPSGIHRDLDARHDALVLRFLADNPDERPEDAFAARRALSALKWPSTLERTPLRKGSEHPRPLREGHARLVPRDDGLTVDTYTGRPVMCLPLDDVTLERARVFAGLDHPLLQPVLKVDRESGTLWLSDADARPLARPLPASDAARVREALAALHAEGLVHGRLDAGHLRERADGSLVLFFSANQGPTGTVDNDRIALAKLVAGA